VLQLGLTAVFVLGCLAYIVTRSQQGRTSPDALGQQALRTTGTVVSMHTGVVDLRGPQTGQPQLDFPIVRFQDASGQQVTFQSATGWTRAPKVGRTVKVAYNPADPQNARLDGNQGRSFHIAAIIALVFLALIIVIGLVVAAFVYRAVHR